MIEEDEPRWVVTGVAGVMYAHVVADAMENGRVVPVWKKRKGQGAQGLTRVVAQGVGQEEVANFVDSSARMCKACLEATGTDLVR